MKTKNITAKFPINEKTVDAVEALFDDYCNSEEDILSFCLNENDPDKVDIVYFYGDYELKYTFTDPEFAESYSKFISHLIRKGKLYEGNHPVITDIHTEGKKLLVDLTIFVTWESDLQAKDIPEQKYIPVKKEPEPTIIQTAAVGINYLLDKDKKTKLEQAITKIPECELKAEPENPQDPCCVAVYLKGFGKIGYITKEDSMKVSDMLKKGEITDTLATYMDYDGKAIQLSIHAKTDISETTNNLFSKYTPMEVYKANYLHKYWGGKFEPDEEASIDWENHKIDFNKFNALSITQQDRIADIWAERMVKADTKNPDNPKWRMGVRLDLADYGTSWKEIDITFEPLLRFIDAENAMLALYIRARRKGYRESPEDFMKMLESDYKSESLMKRMHYEYDNNRL